MAQIAQLKCRLCGLRHSPVQLRPGEKALCSRCDTLLAVGTRLGADAPLCFAITGLILAVPATLLPFVDAEKLGDKQISLLLTGVGAFWSGGMRAMSVLVLLCGTVLPIALLVILTVVQVSARFGRSLESARHLLRAAQILGHWSIPEVQVLAILVAITRLGSLVDLQIGPGFCCYCGMALALVLAQCTFILDTPGLGGNSGDAAVPGPS